MSALAKTLLRFLAFGLLVAGPRPGRADVPLTGSPATFGPGHLEVVADGVGLGTQPATLSVTVPGGASVVAAYLYVTGRGAGDATVTLNGMSTSLPLLATSGPLPFDAAQSVETRRLAVTLAAGSNTFVVDGYDQNVPGGAFVVAVLNVASAPLRTVQLLEGADYAFRGFAPPFGPDTEVGAFTFAAAGGARTARVLLFTHDTRADRGDATWLLAAASGSVPLPARLIGGNGGAQRVQRNDLGVAAGSGGLSVGLELDVDDRTFPVPAGADYLAFQIQSADEQAGADSLALSVATLVRPVTGGDGGGSTTTTTLNGGGGSTTSTTLDGGGGGSTTTTTLNGGGGSTSTTLNGGGRTTTTTPTSSSSTTTVPGGAPAPPNCGDGIVDIDEECDDGNQVPGDGCTACVAEDTGATWKINVRVRPQGVERLAYFGQVRALPAALLGTAPIHVTLASGEFRMLDADIPASAVRTRPRPVLVQPDARFAKAVGDFGIWRIKIVFRPVTGIQAYDVRLYVKGEMLPEVFARIFLTTVIRIGDVVYTTTDPLKASRTGRFLRYIHPVLDD